MKFLLNSLGAPLGILISFSYRLTHNYGLAILLFTVLTRVVLLPISIWLHRYSIRLIRMTPSLLQAQISFWGDNDRIAEEQSKLYKEFKYNPLVTLVPLAIQIILLMGVIQVIYHPFDYILHANPQIVAALGALASEYTGVPVEDSALQLSTIAWIKSGTYTQQIATLTNLFTPESLNVVVEGAQGFQTVFCGIDLLLIPSVVGGLTILAPLAAGFAAFVLCIVQNKVNPLQAEQGIGNKIFTMVLSVGLSMYLGYFVPMGVALYWIAGNLVAVLQQYFLNAIIPPQKYIDYNALNEKQKQLKELKDTKKNSKRSKELVKREKEDIKRFNSVVNKHLVFYSESSGFYKYYKSIIEYILAHTNLLIHYITNDPNDVVFEIAKKEDHLRPYYVAEYKLITLMMKMDADMVVMTTPDLEAFHIKKSYIRNDIEYVYTPHDPLSIHMGFREGALNHFDTVLCQGPQQIQELKRTKEIYNLPEQNLVPCGYALLDDMIADYRRQEKKKTGERTTILIAPTWNEDNILDSCVDELIEILMQEDRKIIIRPHPEYVKRYGARMSALIDRWNGKTGEGLEFETDFSSSLSIYDADVLITDWSGIAYEYSLTTNKPSLFINTKMKVLNPNWEKVGIIPLEIKLRDEIGRSLNKNELKQANAVIMDMKLHADEWFRKIEKVKSEYFFNIGKSGQMSAKYIIDSLVSRKRP